ncbi:MAG: hypothetical protein EXQ88_00635 [Alphaproteobacteria bacterium]|nr:hypothetical protein [Alphaproteobacteria bacterium]
MVQLLRLAAVLVLMIGGVAAIELLPPRVGAESTLTSAVDCVLRDHGLVRAQAQAPAPVAVPVPGVGAPATPGAAPAAARPAAPAASAVPSAAECQLFLPSFYAGSTALIGSLLLGALGSLLYNTRRFREIMEQFAAGASGR